MPGIVGLISQRELREMRVILSDMLGSMLHEPHYKSGELISGDLGLAAGWTTHDKSFSDCLPIWNEEGNVCLLFSGEDHVDPALLSRLRTRGHTFSPGNGSYLVHLYEDLGTSFWRVLNGTFCGLLVDLREPKIVLFNDRFGLGRVYWHERNGDFYFSSEAKAILKVLPDLRRLDPRGLGEYLACGCVLQDRTIFPAISLLPPGASWVHRPGSRVAMQRYFDIGAWESQPSATEGEYYERLRETFARVLPRHLNGCDEFAMSLTGGLDSRMIMAWAGCGAGTLRCYSHRGMFRECLDAAIGRRVASVCGQSHQPVFVDREFLQQFPELARRTVYLSDGAMDVSGAAGLYANQVVRRDISSVRLTGNYGGEILRGLVTLKRTKLRNSHWVGDLSQEIQRGSQTLATEQSCNRTSFIAFRQVPWHHFARFVVENSQLTVRSPYLDNDLVALAYQAPQNIRSSLHLAERLIRDGNPALTTFPTDRGPLGRRGPVGSIREGFQELTFKAEYAYDYGMPQWLARLDRALHLLHLERIFLGRHKYTHYRLWYRDHLAEFVKEVLLDSRALNRPYLDKLLVRELVRAHTTGRGNHTLEIHALLTLEFLHSELLEV